MKGGICSPDHRYRKSNFRWGTIRARRSGVSSCLWQWSRSVLVCLTFPACPRSYRALVDTLTNMPEDCVLKTTLKTTILLQPVGFHLQAFRCQLSVCVGVTVRIRGPPDVMSLSRGDVTLSSVRQSGRRVEHRGGVWRCCRVPIHINLERQTSSNVIR